MYVSYNCVAFQELSDYAVEPFVKTLVYTFFLAKLQKKDKNANKDIASIIYLRCKIKDLSLLFVMSFVASVHDMNISEIGFYY